MWGRGLPSIFSNYCIFCWFGAFGALDSWDPHMNPGVLLRKGYPGSSPNRRAKNHQLSNEKSLVV